MKQVSVAVKVLTVASLLLGCQTASRKVNGSSVESDASSLPNCSHVVDAAAQHFVKLTAEGGKLTILESKPNVRFQAKIYSLRPMQFNHAPSQAPKYFCGSDSGAIKVWEDYALIGFSYFQMTPDNTPSTSEVDCLQGPSLTANLGKACKLPAGKSGVCKWPQGFVLPECAAK